MLRRKPRRKRVWTLLGVLTEMQKTGCNSSQTVPISVHTVPISVHFVPIMAYFPDFRSISSHR